MNQKKNPFVAMAALVVAAIILVLVCAGCSPAAAAGTEEHAPRFVYEYVGKGPGNYPLYIITDTQTGVQYLAWDAYNGAAMTVLQPGEG